MRILNLSSAVKNTSKLIEALSPLLRRAGASEGSSSDNHTPDIGYWTLTPPANGMTRLYPFRSVEQANGFRERIGVVSDEMGHHAGLNFEDPDAMPGSKDGYVRVWMRVTCTTHRPAGLSMRDAKLARKIDELAAGEGLV
jgi:pterin-4a-carbinolamine dehydratase